MKPSCKQKKSTKRGRMDLSERAREIPPVLTTEGE